MHCIVILGWQQEYDHHGFLLYHHVDGIKEKLKKLLLIIDCNA